MEHALPRIVHKLNSIEAPSVSQASIPPSAGFVSSPAAGNSHVSPRSPSLLRSPQQVRIQRTYRIASSPPTSRNIRRVAAAALPRAQSPLPVPAQADAASCDAYWKVRGWQRKNSSLFGYYRAAGRWYRGEAEITSSFFRPPFQFYIQSPPDAFVHGSHSVCLMRGHRGRGKEWYGIHFRLRPPDISTGILFIEAELAKVLR